MKKSLLIKNYALGLIILVAFNVTLTGCKSNICESGDGNKDIPNETEYPNFETKTDINLNVDYEMSGAQTVVEVYLESPMEINNAGNIIKKDILPIFAAYTDENGKFSGKMNLPSSTSEIFLYTPTMGLPRCIVLNVTEGKVSFKLSDLNPLETRAIIGSPNLTDNYPYKLENNLYTLCQWKAYGNQKSFMDYFDAKNKYIQKPNDKEVTSDWVKSIQKMLWDGSDKKNEGLDNSDKLVAEKYTNISIATMIERDGKIIKIEDASITLTFLDEAAWYQNALGYYYYPTDQKPADVSQVKKYIIFPNASTAGSVPFDRDGKNAPLASRSSVSLRYFDENGKVSDRFPAGYTIGWFIISEGFDGDKLNTNKTYLYSNESWNRDKKKRCIALTDKKTGKVVVGFEDGADQSCEDILFFVQSDPREAIIDPDKPTIDDGDVVLPPDKVEERVGTLTFEDVWPYGGDYDMNDVVVEYKQTVTFNASNKVTKIVDTFKPVNNGAKYIDAFAYQITNPAQIGTFTELPAGTTYETATHSFIVYPNNQEAFLASKECVITRLFEGSASFDKGNLEKYNPFIIANYAEGNTKRVEIHLPKHKATDYADQDLLFTYGDAYFIKKDGTYPYALDLPILGFKVVTERSTIGSQGEYPSFTNWVNNGCGTVSADWYLHK